MPVGPIRIRSMEDSDVPFIRQGLSETNWQDIPDDQKRLLDRVECDRRIFRDFNRYLKTKRFKFKVFTAVPKDGSPVGYVSVGESVNPAVGLRFGAVLDFWVAPGFRNRGIGSRLLDHALEHIRSRGYTHASILVSVSNKKALSMYRERGFPPDRVVLMKSFRRQKNFRKALVLEFRRRMGKTIRSIRTFNDARRM